MSIRGSVGVSFIAIAAVAFVAQVALGFGRLFPFNVISIFGLGGALLVVLAGKYLKSRSFGPANLVTLVRAALTAFLFAIIAEDRSSAAAWSAVLIASAALVLDGVDGWIARRLDDVSDFGARFDMETDALLILATSTLVWQFDKAGLWILAAGLMRYMFVAASGLLPWMTQPLPASRRRKTIFVAQAALLILCLVPLVPHSISARASAAGLALLTGSFLIDVAWLARARPTYIATLAAHRGGQTKTPILS